MKLEVVGKSISIPVDDKGVELRDMAKEMLGIAELRKMDGVPCYLSQVGKAKLGAAKKRFLQDIATGSYYWEFFDSSKIVTEVLGGNMIMCYKGDDGKNYGLALFTNEKEILRRMDVRR